MTEAIARDPSRRLPYLHLAILPYTLGLLAVVVGREARLPREFMELIVISGFVVCLMSLVFVVARSIAEASPRKGAAALKIIVACALFRWTMVGISMMSLEAAALYGACLFALSLFHLRRLRSHTDEQIPSARLVR